MPVAGALRGQHAVGLSSAPSGISVVVTTLFSNVARTGSSVGVALLRAAAERGLDLADAVDQPGELLRVERRVVIGSVEALARA